MGSFDRNSPAQCLPQLAFGPGHVLAHVLRECGLARRGGPSAELRFFHPPPLTPPLAPPYATADHGCSVHEGEGNTTPAPLPPPPPCGEGLGAGLSLTPASRPVSRSDP